ncbi:MAG: phosphatase PAP2 family protein [Peptoniphilaceae bacterium]|nr:phosphatase PAP2 family protein [Peptoniphilaceae bacterium]MDY3076498.1 phosphatase PAP2 family protein [Peptoniphilaceae bacterium]MDY5841498.1 phosphatase PAP2 family protein [Peptoniphilaceae bacterium]
MPSKRGQGEIRIGLAFLIIFLVSFCGMLFLQGAVTSVDIRILTDVMARRNDTFSGFFLFFTQLGGQRFLLPLSVGATLWIWLLRKDGVAALWFAAMALFGAALLNPSIKHIIHRARPDALFQMVKEASYSFPSGHSFSSALLYTSLGNGIYFSRKADTRWKSGPETVRIFAAGLALLIALSRVYVGIHYPSDILAGYCLGMGCAYLGSAYYQRQILPRLRGRLDRPWGDYEAKS